MRTNAHLDVTVRTPTDGAVPVSFDEQQADDLQAAVRQPRRLVGGLELDPTTNRPAELKLERIDPVEQLAIDLDPAEF